MVLTYSDAETCALWVYVSVSFDQRILVGKGGFVVIPYPTQGLWVLFVAWWAKLRYTKILIKNRVN
jgi:hypothetical protein